MASEATTSSNNNSKPIETAETTQRSNTSTFTSKQSTQQHPPPPTRPLSPFTPTQNTPSPTTSLLPEALTLANTLFNASRTGSLPPLQTALSHGLPPNLRNDKGDTLLMLASYHGHAALVSLLLSHGADANVLNDRGQSPIAGAMFKGYEDVVKVLLEEGGADVWAGRPSAVDCARMFGREGMLELFGVEGGLSARPWENGARGTDATKEKAK